MPDQVSVLMSDQCAQSDSESDVASDSSSEVVSDGDWLRRTAAAARLDISERMLDLQLAAGRWSNRLTPDRHVEVQVPRPPAEGQREAERGLVLVKRFQQQLEAQTTPLVAAPWHRPARTVRFRTRFRRSPRSLPRFPQPVRRALGGPR